jgi:hypothetical protein
MNVNKAAGHSFNRQNDLQLSAFLSIMLALLAKEYLMDAVQLNVRLPRELKEQGDATLSLFGSSPVRIIRKLWEKLAQGGDAYRDVMRALETEPEPDLTSREEPDPITRSTQLFASMGASMGMDISTFAPSARDPYEVLEESDWELLVEKGLA